MKKWIELTITGYNIHPDTKLEEKNFPDWKAKLSTADWRGYSEGIRELRDNKYYKRKAEWDEKHNPRMIETEYIKMMNADWKARKPERLLNTERFKSGYEPLIIDSPVRKSMSDYDLNGDNLTVMGKVNLLFISFTQNYNIANYANSGKQFVTSGGFDKFKTAMNNKEHIVFVSTTKKIGKGFDVHAVLGTVDTLTDLKALNREYFHRLKTIPDYFEKAAYTLTFAESIIEDERVNGLEGYFTLDKLCRDLL